MSETKYEQKRRHNFKTRYKISIAEYEFLLKKQRKKCAICNKELKLYVDHCHNTKNVRGLLCQHCNSGIGFFKDNTKLILKAIQYLYEAKKNKKRNIQK